MVDKVEITDPYKVDPSLKDKSKKQLEMERNLRNMAIEILEKEERRAQVQHIVEKANEHMQNIVAGLRFLEEHGLLSDDVKVAHTSASGVFTPHLRYKAADADRVLARMGEAPVKKTRRKKADK